MSVPPPDGWQPPQQSGPLPNQGLPYGQSGYYSQQPPPAWQQGSWPPPPGPPHQKGSNLKWLLVSLAVLLVIGITVGATLLFSRGDNGGGTTTPSSSAISDIASANDTGPVAIITDEPTCKEFVGINNSLGDLQEGGWGDLRANLGPATEWTSDQRATVEAVAVATRNAADKAVPLAKKTPHRLVRELYEQFIAYGRAYADSIPTYQPSDDALATANVNASSAIIGICNTITYGSVNRALALGAAPPPSQIAPVSNPDEARPFIEESDDTCVSWIERSDKFAADTAAWEQLDSSVPASQWTPERRTMEAAVLPLLTTYADQLASSAQQSGNPVLDDFGVAASLYIRSYVSVGDKYTSADSWLSYTGFRLSQLVKGACRAVAG